MKTPTSISNNLIPMVYNWSGKLIQFNREILNMCDFDVFRVSKLNSITYNIFRKNWASNIREN